MTAENDELTMTMKRELTGTQKAGYVLVGAFLGIPYLCPHRSIKCYEDDM